MINLMPPEVKKQIRFSKWNTRIVKNGIALIAVGILLLGFLEGAHMYAQYQAEQMRESVVAMTDEAEKFKDIEERAATLSNKLSAIEGLIDNQQQFSALLSDIADVMPDGSRLTNISLTGNKTTPLQINAETDSQIKAGILRNALLTSDRFSAADIQNVSRLTSSQSNYQYAVTLVLAFADADGSENE